MGQPVGLGRTAEDSPDEEDIAEPLVERVTTLERELSALDATIDAERVALRGLRAQARSLNTYDDARALAKSRQVEVAEREAALNQTFAARTNLAEERRAHLATLSRPIPPEPPQAHIARPHQPYLERQERRTRFLKLWAAVSTPLLLGSIIVVLDASPLASITTIAALAGAFIGVEAIARRRFLSFLASNILLIALIALVVGFVLLLLKHGRTAISLLVGAAALALLIGNLRDLRRR